MNSMSPYQEFIYKRTYARFIESENRRERWTETVGRYGEFFMERVPPELRGDFIDAIQDVVNLRVMPSMRCLWTAGEALRQENICGYNCAYLPIKHYGNLGEVLYLLMCGTGVGVSVERQYINQLPVIPGEDSFSVPRPAPIVFEDSKYGWADGLVRYLYHIFEFGHFPEYDLSHIRPKGERLKTFGGRASGPEPLKDLLEFIKRICLSARGRKLNSEEVADIICKTAEVVIVGGVRRSAILMLTNPSDRRMQQYKSGEFWHKHPYRSFANISSCYTEQPDMLQYMEDFMAVMASGTGERGFVNRESLQNTVPDGRDRSIDYGLNPCGEIILRPHQFCNLSEVVVRPDDNLDTLARKVKHAVLFGVLQATLDNFNFVSADWKRNIQEERLLGVSLTGIMDSVWHNPVRNPSMFSYLRGIARDQAKIYAQQFGINTPAAVTCCKPSGTVSQLVNCASGLHTRYASYYIRRVRVASTDPISAFLMDSGVPWQPEVGQDRYTASTLVFEFPCCSPSTAITRHDRSALEQLETWKNMKLFWTDHNPSCTIYVDESEWFHVGAWLYDNWNLLGGITVLPKDTGLFQLAPYEEVTRKELAQRVEDFPPLDWTALDCYEKGDTTTGAQEYSCSGGGCEIV